MDFKNFTLAELKSNFQNLQIQFSINNEKNDLISVKEFQIFSKEKLTISDHLEMRVYKGSENLYLDFNAYLVNDAKFDLFRPVSICIFSKDFHGELKNVINEILKQS